MNAIAAMSLNRVIGAGGQIPWRLPEDFRWFKEATLGQVVIMGRKTFEGLGRPLPGRQNYVLTRHPRRLVGDPAQAALYAGAKVGPAAHPRRRPAQYVLPGASGTELCVVRGLPSLRRAGLLEAAWLAGGAQVYARFLPCCAELYLSLVRREVPGDAFFPPFEEQFEFMEVLRATPDFEVRRYRNRDVRPVEGRAGSG
jgi:dihydrofolate reductase